MSRVDHRSLVIGLAVFGLACLNGRVTFPVSNARIQGLPERRLRFTAHLPFPDPGRADDLAVASEIMCKPLAQEQDTWLPIYPSPWLPS